PLSLYSLPTRRSSDLAPDFVRVVNRQRRLYALEALEHELIRASVSNGARALIELSFGIGPDHEDFPSRHQELLDLYYEDVAVDTDRKEHTSELQSREN